MSQENSTEIKEISTVEDKKTVVENDLSSNIINRFFGLFENMIGSKDFFAHKDVRSKQFDQEEIKPLEVANVPVIDDSIDSKEVAEVVEAELKNPRRPFPTPNPTPSEVPSTISPLDMFKEIYSQSPRKASEYFQKNSKEILNGVTFV